MKESCINELLQELLTEIRQLRASQSRWLDIEEVAKYLSLKTNTVYQYVNQKRIPYKKIPGSSKLIFNRHEIDSWLKNDQPSERNLVNESANKIWNGLTLKPTKSVD